MKISNEDIIPKLEYGTRTLFDLGDFRVLDGFNKDERLSYLIFDFKKKQWYEIDLVSCYHLVTAYHCSKDSEFTLEIINNIIRNMEN